MEDRCIPGDTVRSLSSTVGAAFLHQEPVWSSCKQAQVYRVLRHYFLS